MIEQPSRLIKGIRVVLARDDDWEYLDKYSPEIENTGAIQAAIVNRPSFRRAVQMLGDSVQVLVGRDCGGVAAVAVRAIRDTFLDGRLVRGGYLGHLWIRRDRRSTLTLARGFELLRELDLDRDCEIYTTCINEENDRALRILTSGRAGLPLYVDQGRIRVFVVYPSNKMQDISTDIRPGSQKDLVKIADQLNSARDQFAIAFSGKRLMGMQSYGLTPADFLVKDDGKNLEFGAIWDQRRFRQLVITSYPPLLEAVRLAMEGSGEYLPKPGSDLGLAFFSLLSNSSPEAFRSLIIEASKRLRQRKLNGLLLSLHERDKRIDSILDLVRGHGAFRLFALNFDKPVVVDGRLPAFDLGFM